MTGEEDERLRFLARTSKPLHDAIASDERFWEFRRLWAEACRIVGPAERLSQIRGLLRLYDDRINLYSLYMEEVKRTINGL